MERADNGMQINGHIYAVAIETPGHPAVQIHLLSEGLIGKDPPGIVDVVDPYIWGSLPIEAHEVLSLKIDELTREKLALEGKSLALETELKAQRDWNRQLEEKLMHFVDRALATKTLPNGS